MDDRPRPEKADPGNNRSGDLYLKRRVGHVDRREKRRSGANQNVSSQAGRAAVHLPLPTDRGADERGEQQVKRRKSQQF